MVCAATVHSSPFRRLRTFWVAQDTYASYFRRLLRRQGPQDPSQDFYLGVSPESGVFPESPGTGPGDPDDVIGVETSSRRYPELSEMSGDDEMAMNGAPHRVAHLA